VNQAPGRGNRGTVIGIGARDRGKAGQDRHSVRDCGTGGLCAGSTMLMLTIGNFRDTIRNRSV
jgi:hypothetical protein